MLLDLGQDDPIKGAMRPPPAEPLAFSAGHAFGGKVYTNGADRDKIVAPKFRATIEEVMGGVETLNYNKLGWGDQEIAQLAQVLPLCGRLTKLELLGNQFGHIGMSALASACENGALPQLKELYLFENQIGDVGMQALAGAVSKGALAQLTRLDLTSNSIGDAGLNAFAVWEATARQRLASRRWAAKARDLSVFF